MPPPNLVALEFVVDDPAPAIELLALMGCALVDHYPHPALDADVRIIDAGSVTIALLTPTDHGDRMPLSPPASNLSQLIFDVEGAAPFQALRDRLVDAGAPVVAEGSNLFHLGRQVIDATFGVAPAFVFHTPDVDPPPTEPRSESA